VLHAHPSEKKFYIKGDGCPGADGWIPAENVLGLVARVERGGKARFWRSSSQPGFLTDAYLQFYPLWPPLRRVMARTWRRLRRGARLKR
jgi:hypothetical protein